MQRAARREKSCSQCEKVAKKLQNNLWTSLGEVTYILLLMCPRIVYFWTEKQRL